MTSIRYARASEWGITYRHAPIAERLADPEVAYHHNAGNQTADAFTDFRNSNRAAHAEGMACVAYDILVHYAFSADLLTIGGGREGYMSAATLDRNEQAEAVMIYGYFHPGHKLSRQPYPAEIEGAALGTVWGIRMGWIAENPNGYGHRDNPAHPKNTVCPGDYFNPYIPIINNRVRQIMEPSTIIEIDNSVELIKIDFGPAVYQRTGHLVTHVTEERWVAMGAPMNYRGLHEEERKCLTIVGPYPAEHRGWFGDER